MYVKRSDKHWASLLALTTLCLVLLPTAARADLFASGELTTTGGGLVANGVWSTNGASVSYQVSSIDASSWLYEYEVTIEGTQGALSHIILETSQNADIRELTASGFFELEGPTTFGQGGSNPGMPGDIYGIKLDDLTGMTFTFSFESYNGPMWGNIYAKDGRAGSDGWNYLYNAGFGTPLSDAERYEFNNEYLQGRYILVPDTYVIPAPAAVLLGVLGLGTAGVRLRRRM